MKIHTTDSDQDLTFEVRLKVPVTEEQLDDFLLTAQCDYWSKTLRYNLRGVGGGHVWTIQCTEHPLEGRRFAVTRTVILKGLERLARAIFEGRVHPDSEIGAQFLRFLGDPTENDDLDPVACDAIVQEGLFGEIVYG
jgi:hypothetical protein